MNRRRDLTMATAFKQGDRVQIQDRSATAEDAKSGLFYEHFRGLTGTIQNLYSNDEVGVEIEISSLDESVAKRHAEVQEAMKTKWLDGLSEEARNRLTDKERDFRLRYTVLVQVKDLTAPGSASTPAEKSAALRAAPPRPAAKTAPVNEPPAREAAAQDPAPPARPTLADLAAKEEEELQRRRQGT
jgi:ribosomal protein L21E